MNAGRYRLHCFTILLAIESRYRIVTTLRPHSMKQLFFGAFAALLLLGSLNSCKTPKSADSELASMDLEKEGPKKTMYLTGTRPASQLAKDEKLNYDIWKIEHNDYPNQIRLYARVFDSTGNFITHLAPPAHPSQEYWGPLTEKLGKRTVPVSPFSVKEFSDADSIPYAINLLLDYSGSMKGVMDAIYEGTDLFIKLKQDRDRIAIASFNKEFEIKVPFENDPARITRDFHVVRDQSFGLYSAFYDGLLKSIHMFDSLPQSMPRILVAFSDGDDNYSSTKLREVFQLAQEQNVHIFTVGFGYSHDEVLDYVAQNTGGKSYKVYSKKELVNVFLEIYRSLRNYYLVTYKPPEFPGLHHVALRLTLPSGDTATAFGQYDKSAINIFNDTTNHFSYRIPFDYNQATLKPEAQIMIEGLVDQLERYERVWLEVQGHTDNIGGEEFNQRLSEARAKAVVDALISHGIDAKRLKPRGMGMLYPLFPNDTDEHRAANRRTEFRILRK